MTEEHIHTIKVSVSPLFPKGYVLEKVAEIGDYVSLENPQLISGKLMFRECYKGKIPWFEARPSRFMIGNGYYIEVRLNASTVEYYSTGEMVDDDIPAYYDKAHRDQEFSQTFQIEARDCYLRHFQVDQEIDDPRVIELYRKSPRNDYMVCSYGWGSCEVRFDDPVVTLRQDLTVTPMTEFDYSNLSLMERCDR